MKLKFPVAINRKGKIIVAVAVVVAITAISTGAAISLTREEMEPMPSLSDVEIPPDILLWLEDNRETEGYGAFFREGTIFVAARMGMRPTGGYSVVLGEPKVDSESLKIKIEFLSPNPWDIVTQAITYPYAVVAVDAAGNRPGKAHFYGPGGGIIATVPVQYPAAAGE